MECVSYGLMVSLVSWNLPNGPKHGASILRNMVASSEGDQSLAGAFHANYGQNRGSYISNCKEVQLEMNLHISRILFSERFQLQMPVCTKIRAPARLVRKFRAKYEKVPTKISKRDARTNSSEQNLKFFV